MVSRIASSVCAPGTRMPADRYTARAVSRSVHPGAQRGSVSRCGKRSTTDVWYGRLSDENRVSRFMRSIAPPERASDATSRGQTEPSLLQLAQEGEQGGREAVERRGVGGPVGDTGGADLCLVHVGLRTRSPESRSHETAEGYIRRVDSGRSAVLTDVVGATRHRPTGARLRPRSSADDRHRRRQPPDRD